MALIYRVLETKEEFYEASIAQKEIFDLNDIDVISPHTMALYCKKIPPMGTVIAAFDDQTICGLTVALPAGEKNAWYSPMIGVKPQYQNLGIGIKLLTCLKDEAIKHDINAIYGTYHIFDHNLALMYYSRFGFYGIFLEKNKTLQGDDSILIKWPITDERFLLREKRKITNTQLIKQYSDIEEITEKKQPLDNLLKIKLPPKEILNPANNNLEKIKSIKEKQQKIYEKYINHLNYRIIECLRQKTDQHKEYFYVLEKQIKDSFK